MILFNGLQSGEQLVFCIPIVAGSNVSICWQRAKGTIKGQRTVTRRKQKASWNVQCERRLERRETAYGANFIAAGEAGGS